MSMEIKDMQAFFAVVEEGNISHAAIRLAVAQPALSRQMKRLEGELGVKLFERGSRRIRLTEAGRILYSKVGKILGMVDGAVREITEIGAGLSGSIRIGTITSSGALVLPGLMKEFHLLYPKVTFKIWEGEGTRILEMLDAHAIEIAVTRTQVGTDDYSSVILSNEPLVMVMNKSSCTAGSSDETVKTSELEGQPIIVPPRWKASFEAECRRAGFVPDFVCESDSIVQDVLNVRSGLGMALVPMSATSLITDDGSLVIKRLTDPEIMTHTVVSWLKNHTISKNAENFIALLRKIYGGKIN